MKLPEYFSKEFIVDVTKLLLSTGGASLIATQCAYHQINRPESISLHPTAVKYDVVTQGRTFHTLLKEIKLGFYDIDDQLCWVNREKLEAKVAAQKPLDQRVNEYISATLELEQEHVTAANYGIATQEEYKFETLVNEKVFDDCKRLDSQDIQTRAPWQPRTCEVDHSLLRSFIEENDGKTTEHELEYLKELSKYGSTWLQRSYYRWTAAGSNLDLSWNRLEKDEILHGCQDKAMLVPVSIEAAVILSEDHPYLISKNCLLSHGEPTKLLGITFLEPPKLPIRILSTQSGVPSETFLVDKPTQQIFLKFSEPMEIGRLKELVLAIDASRKASGMLNSSSNIQTSLTCTAYFHNKPSFVGGLTSGVRALPGN